MSANRASKAAKPALCVLIIAPLATIFMCYKTIVV